MILNFVPKEPGKAYIADRLWLPKSHVRPEPVKGALQFTVQSEGKQIQMSMWDESQHHIICPREFLPPSEYKRYKFPFIDLRPQFQHVPFESTVVPRNEEQRLALEALLKNDNGILNLACGKGKTVLSTVKIAQKQVPTLIVVPDGGILSQWEETILGNKSKGREPALKFKGELGLIKGPVFNWAKPITLALVTTLWMRIEQGAVPEEMFRYFGLIVYDEVHQIGAPKFSLTATPFYGDRIGLTATIEREDGMDPIYRYHIGEPFYSDLSQELIPRTYIQQTPITLDYEKARSDAGTINVSILRSMLGRSLEGNIYRYWKIKEAADAGRKVLALSHSIDQLKLMHAMFPESGLIIGSTPQNERMDILRNSKICFAISKLGSTGIDDSRLDTLFWLTPFRSKSTLQQSAGRIQRVHTDKMTPVIVIFEDWTVPTLRKMCSSLKSTLKKWEYPLEVCNPTKSPTTLPPGVQKAYDKVFASLPERGEVIDEE